MTTNKEIGAEGENLAIRTLKKKGYRIIQKNYRTKFGEIDIIAEDKDCLVFIEVKRRSTGIYGMSFDAVSRTKKGHIIRTAQCYLKEFKCQNRKTRFDVVGIDEDEIRIVQHAFIVEDSAVR
ncbi:MAG TPA: YraN family protein [Syntrophorhabdaceae bacterium]|nr:YraN family protein [Syntrophorhabdaceae bacterium]